MELKKRLKYLFVVFVVGLCFVLFVIKGERGNVSKKERTFSVENLLDVNTIIISDQLNDDEVLLEFKNNKWKANSNLVRKDKIDVFTKIIVGLKVKNRIAVKDQDSLLNEFNTSSLSVKYLNGSHELLSYKVLFDKKNNLIVLGDDSSMPYYAHLYGEEIDFSALFSAEITDWSSLVVADFTNLDVTDVCCDYPQMEEERFCVTTNDTLIQFSSSGIVLSAMNFRNGVDYLRAFKELKAKRMFSNKKVINELITDQSPFFILEITASERLTTIIGYKKRAGLGQVDFSGKALEFDNEYFYIKLNDQLFLVDYFSFEVLLKASDWFLK
jgi:hypothetical protein